MSAAEMHPRVRSNSTTIHYAYDSASFIYGSNITYDYASTSGASSSPRTRTGATSAPRVRVAASGKGNSAPRVRVGSTSSPRVRTGSTMKGR